MKIKDLILEEVNMLGEDSVSSFKFTTFTLSLATMYVMATRDLLAKDMVNAYIKGAKTGGKGKPKDSIKTKDIMTVLTGNDFFRYFSLFNQSEKFLVWYFEQEISEDNCDPRDCKFRWEDVDELVNKWNEFVDHQRATNG